MADPTFRVVVTLDGVDVTSELGEWSTDAGRSNPLERIGLATASITLDNQRGRFDPTLGRVAVGDTLRIDTVKSGLPTPPDPIFNGYVTSVTMGIDVADSVVVIEASERPARDPLIAAGSYVTDPSVGSILETAAANAGTGSEVVVLFDVIGAAYDAKVTAGFVVDGTTTFWDFATAIVEAAGGTLAKLSNTEAFLYKARSERVFASWGYYLADPLVIGDGSVAAEPYDLPRSFELVVDDSDIVNDATVSREWNTPDASASAASSTSIATHGRRSLERKGPFTDAGLAEIATSLVSRYAAPSVGLREVVLDHAEFLPYDALLPAIWSVYFYTGLVEVVYRPPYDAAAPRSVFYLVDGRTLEGAADGSIRATLRLAVAHRDGYALFGTDAFGGYGVGRYA